MLRIDEKIIGTLNNWGKHPALLQLSAGQECRTIGSLELVRSIAETARQLEAWGIRQKYLVPVFLGNSTDFVVIFLSLIRIGAIPLMVKMEYRAMELKEIFSNARPQATVAEKQHLHFLRPYLQNTIVIVRDHDRFSLEQSMDGLAPREDIPEDIASINYTYRGYGYPLGAMVSHAQYLHGAHVLQDGLHGAPGEKMLVILPMSHIFCIVACILVPLLHRMTGVVASTVHPRLLFQHIHDLQIDYITSVPEIFELLGRLRDPTFDLSSLKVFISGGSMATAECCSSLTSSFSIEFCHGYGLTECTPVSGNRRFETRIGTVGPVCDQIECRIDSHLPQQTGEILVKTPYRTGLYYGRQRESEEAHVDGWFKTGDIGTFDRGHLVFLRELKRTCKINGNLVDVEEVARAIRMQPDVQDVQVQLEKKSLQAMLALRQPRDFHQKVNSLKSSLREVLAEYKIPRLFRSF